MAKRAFLIVLDSVGIGAMPDAGDWGDEGSNTVAAIRNHPDFSCPNLEKMGLFGMDGMDEKIPSTRTCYARMTEASKGKDTTIGHWEIAGIYSPKPLPTYPNGFPQSVIEEFEKLTGESFERMMKLDSTNFVGGNKDGFRDPTKYMMYNDPFFGWLDTQAKTGVDAEYRKIARRFALYAKKSENFSYIYDTLSKLAKVLSYKYDLGIRAREAYQVRDEAALKGVVEDFKKTEKALKSFYKSFCALWHYENKPNGFEIHDMRLGGLMQRLTHCRERLEDYLNGKGEVPELDVVLLDFWGNGTEYCKDTPCYPNWGMIITPNQLN